MLTVEEIREAIERATPALDRPPMELSGFPNTVAQKRDLRTLLAAASAHASMLEGGASEMVGWRPIETAPKDGTPIVVGRDMGDFGWITGWATWEAHSGISGWIAREMGSFHGVLGLGHPTHWMPLPAPPAPGEGG